MDVKVVELLKSKGALSDSELLGLVKESYGDLGVGELNKVLLRLEIGGRIRVSSSTRGKRRVELREERE